LAREDVEAYGEGAPVPRRELLDLQGELVNRDELTESARLPRAQQ
jgi:hypothetical protein